MESFLSASNVDEYNSWLQDYPVKYMLNIKKHLESLKVQIVR